TFVLFWGNAKFGSANFNVPAAPIRAKSTDPLDVVSWVSDMGRRSVRRLRSLRLSSVLLLERHLSNVREPLVQPDVEQFPASPHPLSTREADRKSICPRLEPLLPEDRP